jgi:hypothetical protein
MGRAPGWYTDAVVALSAPAAMREAAAALLGTLDGPARESAALPFSDDGARRWLEYRPRPRPGACLADMDRAARKAAHRLLATGLGDHAYAQAMTVLALEEVLDRREGWVAGRHSDDYRVVVFGDPGGDAPWSWRFEGHHLSVSMTVAGNDVWPSPVFLGANPARVAHAGRAVLRPLAPEEDLARAMLEAMGPTGRALAIVSAEAPADLRSGPRPRAGRYEPLGVSSAGLRPAARAVLDQLVALYLDRLPPELAAWEAARIAAGELHFAWEGPTAPGGRHYYRIQGDDLLIEYDNTEDDGNHQHTVLRRPRGDFGGHLSGGGDGDVLAAHRAEAHGA